MSESYTHAELVRNLKDFVVNEYLNGDDGCVLVDSAAVERNDRAYQINGYVPDVIASPVKGKLSKIIGEAKTIQDIETTHSLHQIEAFLRYCTQAEDSLFIVAVPWPYGRTVRNIVKRIAKKTKLKAEKCIVPDIFQA